MAPCDGVCVIPVYRLIMAVHQCVRGYALASVMALIGAHIRHMLLVGLSFEMAVVLE